MNILLFCFSIEIGFAFSNSLICLFIRTQINSSDKINMIQKITMIDV